MNKLNLRVERSLFKTWRQKKKQKKKHGDITSTENYLLHYINESIHLCSVQQLYNEAKTAIILFIFSFKSLNS